MWAKPTVWLRKTRLRWKHTHTHTHSLSHTYTLSLSHTHTHTLTHVTSRAYPKVYSCFLLSPLCFFVCLFVWYTFFIRCLSLLLLLTNPLLLIFPLPVTDSCCDCNSELLRWIYFPGFVFKFYECILNSLEGLIEIIKALNCNGYLYVFSTLLTS